MKRIDVSRDKLAAVGSRVKALRKSLKISQKDFAAFLNISPSYLSEIEHGNSNPGFDFFYKISTACNVSLDYLFHGIGEMMLKDKIKFEEIKEEKEYVRDIVTVDDLLWLIEHSDMFKNTIMGFAAKFNYENEETIKKNIENLRAMEEDKKNE